jgi:methylated-DNA-[protein]-cysteine S-methyltransferase
VKSESLLEDEGASAPSSNDGLNRKERAVLVALAELERERAGAGAVPMTLLYGRVVTRIDLSVQELQAIVGRLSGRGAPPPELRTRTIIASPLGPLTAVVTPRGLVALSYEAVADLPLLPVPEVETALAAYFAGELHAIDSLRVDPAGTPFQREVWTALRDLPVGRTLTYAELAAALHRSAGASRAVGGASGANPIAIVVPCHRVVAAGGKLGGYAGGLERKRWLLAHEQRHTPFKLG